MKQKKRVMDNKGGHGSWAFRHSQQRGISKKGNNTYNSILAGNIDRYLYSRITHVGVLKKRFGKHHLNGVCCSTAVLFRKRDSSSHACCILSNSRCRRPAVALLSASTESCLSHSWQQTNSPTRGASVGFVMMNNFSKPAPRKRAVTVRLFVLCGWHPLCPRGRCERLCGFMAGQACCFVVGTKIYSVFIPPESGAYPQGADNCFSNT